MTKKCIEQIYQLQNESELFCELTVEQLLYAAIMVVGFNEVKCILELTNWEEIENEIK